MSGRGPGARPATEVVVAVLLVGVTAGWVITSRWRAAGVGGRDRRLRFKRRSLRVLLRPGNAVLRVALRRGIAPRAFALVETRGRRSGLVRHTPVGNGLHGDTFWLIAAHGHRSDFVGNIIADSRVRVLVDGRWRTGVAVPLPEDDTTLRSRTLPYAWDARIGRALATAALTVRIDLESDGNGVGTGGSPVQR